MRHPSGKQLLFARVVSLLLLPVGLACLVVPFWIMTLPGRAGMIDDTRAAFGSGRDATPLEAIYVDCVRQRVGSNYRSSRGVGMTEYDCVIDLATATPAPASATPAQRPAPPQAEPLQSVSGDTRSYEAAMADFNRRTAEATRRQAEQDRQYQVDLDAFIAQSRARSDVSNRLERTLATNRSGQLPAVRILSADDEPRRVGLVWGVGELAWRWSQWLVISLIFFAFAGAILFAVRLAWRRRPAA